MVAMGLKEMDTIGKSIKEFKTLGVDISENTTQRRFKDASLKYVKPLSKPLLSNWHLRTAFGVGTLYEELQLEPGHGD